MEKDIKKYRIELLDCQIFLILKSLELDCQIYQFIYSRNKKSKTLEENLQISLLTDTYNQILEEINNEENLKKVS